MSSDPGLALSKPGHRAGQNGLRRFRVLATDYDNTIASHGRVTSETLDALRRVKETGLRLLMVTGRTMEELGEVFAHAADFDLIVAENGALIHRPSDGAERLLGNPVSPGFVAELRRRHVSPLAVGKVVCSTLYPHHATVVEVIHDLGLDLHVILNKGSVMMLPIEVNKASGTRAALRLLGERATAMIAVGDAENDLMFLAMAGCAVAVANALDSVKAKADLVMSQPAGGGVAELAEHLVNGDLSSMLRRGRGRAG